MIISVAFNKECLLPWGGTCHSMGLQLSPKRRCNILQKCLQLFPKKTCKKHYQITSVRDSIFLPESRDYICPTCRKGHLHYRDHCRRIVRHEGGEAEWFFIPRSRCDNAGCRRLHRMLPDFMVQFKHYSAEVISGVLDGFVTPEDADSEDRPSADTMKRWHHWLMANEQYIDGTLKSVGFRDLGFGEELLRSGISLLRELRRSSERWLETILCFIYNSGGFLVPA